MVIAVEVGPRVAKAAGTVALVSGVVAGAAAIADAAAVPRAKEVSGAAGRVAVNATMVAFAGGSATVLVGASAVVGVAEGVMAVNESRTKERTLAAIAKIAGSIILGATCEKDKQSTVYTYDCWKSVLREESREPSNGKWLKEVISDPRVKEMIVVGKSNDETPQLILQNVWGDQFRIDYILLPSGQLASHAVQI